MLNEVKPEDATARYGVYVEDLRAFLTSRDVPCGSRDDLISFAQQLTKEDSFTEEMGSMVRSFVYQEDEKLGRGDLLEVVVAAVAGPEDTRSRSGQETPEQQQALRQIFLFINGAIRQTHATFAELPELEEEIVTAGDVLGSQRIEEELPRPLHTPAVHPRTAPIGLSEGNSDKLYRAMHLAQGQDALPRLHELPSAEIVSAALERHAEGSPWWVIPGVALAVALLLAGAYVARPWWQAQKGGEVPMAAAPATSTPTGTGLCVPPMVVGVPRSGLEERSRWVHTLLNQGLYAAALPELREISRLDPGFPGIKLDEAQALFHMKRPEDALEAVDAQISTSECLARLPAPALNAYCESQFSSVGSAGCRSQLKHYRQAAELQAALIHLELGQQISPGTNAATIEDLKDDSAESLELRHTRVRPAAKPKRVEPLPPATEGDSDMPPLARDTSERHSADHQEQSASRSGHTTSETAPDGSQ